MTRVLPLHLQQGHLGESLLGLEDFSLRLGLVILVSLAVKSRPPAQCPGQVPQDQMARVLLHHHGLGPQAALGLLRPSIPHQVMRGVLMGGTHTLRALLGLMCPRLNDRQRWILALVS